MLIHLRVKDFIIVRCTELEFRSGLTVLTGETGAGKSMLIDALGLLGGGRTETGVVRQGAERAELEAAFDITALPDLRAWLLAQDLDAEDGIVLLRRTIDTSGRSRAFINGRAATVAQLREIGEYLIDIHGQHDHQTLLKAGMQRDLVDSYAGLTETRRRLRAVFRELGQVRQRIDERRRNAQAVDEEIERLTWQINDVKPVLEWAADWDALQAQHGRLANAAELLAGAGAAVEQIQEADDALLGRLNALERHLAELAAVDAGLNEPAGLLESAAIQLKEAAHLLRRYADRVDIDAEELAEVSARLQQVMDCARRHRVPPEELPACHAAWTAQLARIGGTADDAGLAEQESALLAEAEQLAAALTAGRQKAAALLADRITSAMQSLAMAGGLFTVALRPEAALTAHGHEDVEFLVAAHASLEPRPLARVASGGELSRISLAIAVITSEVMPVPVLIFDEVDAGIGGRVAEMVGAHLKALGRDHQVLVITHLAQVAAQGENHWQVFKTATDSGVCSDIRMLDEADRVAEIARMMAGTDITSASLAHAREMLARS